MGQTYLPILAVAFLILLVSPGISSERILKKLKVIKNEEIEESVEIALKVTEQMENIVDALAESDLVSTSYIILNSSEIIGDLLCRGPDHLIPENNEAIKKLDNATEMLAEKMKETSGENEKAKSAMEVFAYDTSFGNKITAVNNLTADIMLFFKERTPALMESLNQSCQEIPVESTFKDMKNLFDTNVITKQLQFYRNSDKAFAWTEKIYKNMMKQLLVAFPLCKTLAYGQRKNGTTFEERSEHVVQLVIEIEEKLKEVNEKRKIAQLELQSSNYALEALESRVRSYKRQPNKGREIKTLYGKAYCGEHFAILVAKNVWLTVKLFTQKITSICGETSSSGKPWLSRKKFLTTSGAIDGAYEWQNLLEGGAYYEVLQYE